MEEISENKTVKSKKKIIIICACAAAAVIAAFAAALGISYAGIDRNRVCENVYVESLDAGGMTYDELLETIKASYLLKDQDITLKCQGQRYTIDGASIGIGANAEETAKKAFEYAKSGSFIKDAFSALRLKISPVNIIPSAFVDEERLDEELCNFGRQVYGELQEPTVVVQANGYAHVDPGKSGFDNDPSAARGEVVWNIQYESFEDIPVTLEKADPRKLSLEEFDATVYQDMRNARYVIDGKEVIVEAEAEGRYIDKEQASEMLDKLEPGGEPVEIPFTAIEPEVKAEELSAKLFASRLGTFSTSYASSNAGRKKNVALAASKLDGVVIPAGEVFSFNETVGPRTTANGFFQAPEYANGESVIGIGGGTCQVSTTLFNTVLLADLQIVSRSAHSLPVHYVPLGRDATVSNGGPDFKFRNNTEYPIKLATNANGSTLTISVYGAPYEPERSVKLSVANNGAVYTLSRTTTSGEDTRKEIICSSKYGTHKE